MKVLKCIFLLLLLVGCRDIEYRDGWMYASQICDLAMHGQADYDDELNLRLQEYLSDSLKFKKFESGYIDFMEKNPDCAKEPKLKKELESLRRFSANYNKLVEEEEE